MLEILKQNGFTEEEARTLESRDDYETVKLQVERVQIDNNLDALETRSTTAVETQSQTLEEKWQAFKDALSQLEQSAGTPTSLPETLEEIKTRMEAEAMTKAETAIREQVGDIPLIGEGIASWLISSGKEMLSSATDTSMGGQIKKWFVMFVAGIFGVDSIYSQLQESIDASKNAQLPEVEIPKVDMPIGESLPKISDTEDVIDENLTISNIRYNTGLNVLFYFSGVEVGNNNSDLKNKIYDSVKNLSLLEVQSLKDNSEKQKVIFGELYDSPGFLEMLNIILDGFIKKETQELIEISLGGNSLINILKPAGVENSYLFRILGRNRANELIGNAQVGSFSIANLSIYEISILYSSILPFYALSQVGGLINIGNEVFEGSREEIGELTNSSIPSEILVNFGKKGPDFGGRLWLERENNSVVKEEIGNGLTGENITKLDSLIVFKDMILSEVFLSSPKIKLSSEYRDAFTKNLNYARVIGLYDILRGNSIDTISDLNLPLLILLISHIIAGSGSTSSEEISNQGLASSYRGGFIHEGLSLAFFGNNSLTETQKRIIEIYGGAFADTGLKAWVQHVYGISQLGEGITGISDENMFLGSSGLLFAGTRITASAFARSSAIRLGAGTALTRLGFYGMLIYGGILGYEYYNSEDTGDVENDIPENNSRVYIGKQIDTDMQNAETVEEQEQVISRLHESTHEYDIGGEKLIVVSYPGEVPHVIYKGKIWLFEVIDDTQVTSDLEDYIIDSIGSVLNGEQINEGDIPISVTGENIDVGGFVFPLEELFGNTESLEEYTMRDLSSAIEERFPGSNFGGRDLNYISLTKLRDGTNEFVSLIPVGNIGDTPTS